MAWSLYLATDLWKDYQSDLGCSEKENLLQERLLDVLLEVSRVGEDAAGEEEDEEDEDEGEVGGEHALALLPGAATTKEGDDDHDSRDCDEDVGGRGVDVEAQAVRLVTHHILRLEQPLLPLGN